MGKAYRIYTGPDGLSHAESIEVFPDPAKNYADISKHITPLRKVTSAAFRSQAVGFFADWHMSPHPHYSITLSGEVEWVLGDGTVIRSTPGTVALFEETSGKGHTTRVLSKAPRQFLALTLE